MDGERGFDDANDLEEFIMEKDVLPTLRFDEESNRFGGQLEKQQMASQVGKGARR